MSVSTSTPQAPHLEREELLHRLKTDTQKCYYCGICEPLCPVFTPLFELRTRDIEEGQEITLEDFKPLIELCYYCKLCLVACGIGVDFPRLMLDGKIYFVQQHGQSLQNRLLMNTERIGKSSSRLAPLVNAALANGLNRRLMEAVVGIDRRRTMPQVAREPFPRWMARHQPLPNGRRKVALFSGCFIDYYDPEVGIAAVQVLEHNGVEILYPEQHCCGIPMLADGSIDQALRNFEYNIQVLAPLVKQGYEIVIISTPCSMTFKQEVVQFLGTDEAHSVARNTFDISQYLLRLHRQGKLDTQFQPLEEKLAYHVPCAAKVQRIESAALELLRLIPKLDLQHVDRGCCGFDGTFGFKKQYFDVANQVGEELFQTIRESDTLAVATDCPLCEVQIADGAAAHTLHPVEVIKRAYGL